MRSNLLCQVYNIFATIYEYYLNLPYQIFSWNPVVIKYEIAIIFALITIFRPNISCINAWNELMSLKISYLSNKELDTVILTINY